MLIIRLCIHSNSYLWSKFTFDKSQQMAADRKRAQCRFPLAMKVYNIIAQSESRITRRRRCSFTMHLGPGYLHLTAIHAN